MPFFFNRKKNSKTLRSEVAVSCPRCGRETAFSYGAKLPEAEKLVCPDCGEDLRRAFLSEAMAEQVRLHKKVRFKLLLYLAAVTLSLLFLAYYAGTHAVSGWLYFLIGLNALMLLAGIALSLRNSRYLAQIRKKQREFGL